MISHSFKIITDIQNCLTPDKANIMLISKTLNNECTEIEKWFKTRYCIEGLSRFLLYYISLLIFSLGLFIAICMIPTSVLKNVKYWIMAIISL